MIVVFELAENDNRRGLFQTLKGAKTRAQEILNGYEALEREEALRAAKGEERQMQEFITAPGEPLDWRMMQHYLHTMPYEDPEEAAKQRLGRPLVPIGDPVLTAIYAERSWFTVHRRRVNR